MHETNVAQSNPWTSDVGSINNRASGFAVSSMPTTHTTSIPNVEQALDLWGDTVLRLALCKTGNRADAEDVLQTVFMKLCQNQRSFESDNHMKAWLLRVTLTCCADVHRDPWRQRRAQSSEADIVFEQTAARPEPARPSDFSDEESDLFEGAQLTVTATFNDGHTTTQIIELHAANFKATSITENSAIKIQLTPEIIETTSGEEGVDYVHTLYGEVIETTNRTFPGSLENTNEFADTVGPAATISGRPALEEMRREDGSVLTIDDSGIHASSEPLSIFNHPSLLSDFSVLERSKSIPASLTLQDIKNGMTDGTPGNYDWTYFNQIVSQVDGYQLDENGVPSEGYSWVMLQGDITNTSKSRDDLTCDGGFYGTIAIKDQDNKLYSILSRSFKIINGTGWDASTPSGTYYDVALAPNETLTVRWLAIVPDYILDDPNLLFVTSYYGENPQAFRMAMPQ